QKTRHLKPALPPPVLSRQNPVAEWTGVTWPHSTPDSPGDPVASSQSAPTMELFRHRASRDNQPPAQDYSGQAAIPHFPAPAGSEPAATHAPGSAADRYSD